LLDLAGVQLHMRNVTHHAGRDQPIRPFRTFADRDAWRILRAYAS